MPKGKDAVLSYGGTMYQKVLLDGVEIPFAPLYTRVLVELIQRCGQGREASLNDILRAAWPLQTGESNQSRLLEFRTFVANVSHVLNSKLRRADGEPFLKVEGSKCREGRGFSFQKPKA